MLFTDDFPTIFFVNQDGTERALEISKVTGRIRAVAQHIGSQTKPGAIVGVAFRSEPNLLINWLACLLAGCEPLMLQYPTRKQTRSYWLESVQTTIANIGLDMLVADDNVAAMGLGAFATVLPQTDLDRLADVAAEPIRLRDYAIVQLSSGSTGHRKALRFTSDQLATHVESYNTVMRLTRDDCIASWLPLYHDMGFIPCFVMPLMLGVDIVMIDAMAWIADPGLLTKAIQRHAATTCFMPNFAYEVMAKRDAVKLPSMRHWLSAGEPISAASIRTFFSTIGGSLDRFSALYGMAENIGAITQRRGLATRTIDGVDVVSCGPPIPGVELKIEAGELCVRSNTAAQAYLNGAQIIESDGFYRTGDLGEIHDGELYVTGRKQDLMIQAGRKFMLSDIDLALNRLYPEVRGRAATVAVRDERLGTERPVVLFEAADFFLRQDGTQIETELRAATGLDQLTVAFVPPRFLTKTSSGKINRSRSALDWLASRSVKAAARPRDAGGAILAELRTTFATASWDEGVGEALDSLSSTVLRIMLAEAGIPFDAQKSLRDYETQLEIPVAASPQAEGDVIRVVSLVNSLHLSRLQEQHVRELGRALDCEVTFEHVCLPPSPIILSDLIFNDYFQGRCKTGNFTAVNQVLDKLRTASMIMIDDHAEMFFPPEGVYGVLSHNLQRDAKVDRIATRWQSYSRFHDQLPLALVSGTDLPIENATATTDQLAQYLGKPIFRIAKLEGFAPFTELWEYKAFQPNPRTPLDPDALIEALRVWIGGLRTPLDRWPNAGKPALRSDDMAHYCSILLAKEPIDDVLGRFDRFCIAGKSGSLPYVRNQLQSLGKSYVEVPSFAPDTLAQVSGQYDCLLICGAWGDYPIETPAAELMFSNFENWKTKDIDGLHLGPIGFLESPAPKSAMDWFYPFAQDRSRCRKEIMTVRAADRQHSGLSNLPAPSHAPVMMAEAGQPRERREAEALVRVLYKEVLQRQPGEAEFEAWSAKIEAGMNVATVVQAFFNSPEGRRRKGVQTQFPHGHYYSPVVDPATVRDYVEIHRSADFGSVPGVPIDNDRVRRFWSDNLGLINATPYSDAQDLAWRFYVDNKTYPWGDAAILRAVIAANRPRRIVEIGSGFSSACMLDSFDEFGLATALTCIEPDTVRLDRLLRPRDRDRVRVIKSLVQDVPLDVFQELEAGDILFIDSTHVLKTGSDVHYELFYILPVLEQGVLIHFHDVPYPFEYPAHWLYQLNPSWNEAYALRAFLAFNEAFQVYFWNSLMPRLYAQQVEQECPRFLTNPGSGVWVIRH